MRQLETLQEKVARLIRQSGIPADIKSSYLAILPYLPDDRILSMVKKLKKEKLIREKIFEKKKQSNNPLLSTNV